MNKKGVTLIELLIYIALFAILALLIGRQFKALINNYTSGKRITRQQTDTRDIIGLMVREIRNTGLKTSFAGSGTGITLQAPPAGTYVSATDKSSFTYTNVAFPTAQTTPCGDVLTILKAKLTNTGSLDCVEKIKYYLDGTTIKREYTKNSDAASTSIVADNVYVLQFRYGVLPAIVVPQGMANWKSAGSPTATGTTELTLAFGSPLSGYLQYPKTGTGFSIVANRNYTVSLQIDPSDGFPGNLTSMEFSFRDATHVTKYGSETFKPFGTGDTITLTVPVQTSSAAAFAYLDYTSSGTGTLLVKGIEAQCTNLELDPTSTTTWTDDPNTVEKKLNTRAIKVLVLTRTSDKAGTKIKTGNEDITIADVKYKRAAEYTWRLYTETIETPNNGNF